MAFKIHKTLCSCHQQERWVVNKKLECNETVGKRRIANSKKSKINRVFNNSKSAGLKRNVRSIAKTIIKKRLVQFNAGAKDGTPKRKTTIIRRRKKPTGELDAFKSIYEERGPYSQISGQYINFDIRCFSHVLTKGAYPAFRLYKKNIILKTPEEHHRWETQRHKLKELPEWKWFFELEQELKQEYYANTRLTKIPKVDRKT